MSVVPFPGQSAGHNSAIPASIDPSLPVEEGLRMMAQQEYNELCGQHDPGLYLSDEEVVRDDYETDWEYHEALEQFEHKKWCFERRRWKFGYKRLELALVLKLIPRSPWTFNLDYDQDILRFDTDLPEFFPWDVYRESGKEIIFRDRFKDWLFWMQRGMCGYCGCDLYPRGNACSSVDHMQPRSRGGSHLPRNLLLVCVSCNSAKCDKTVEKFRDLVCRRQSPVFGIISKKQTEKLLELGIDLKIPRGHKFVFEHLMWKHAAGIVI